MCPEGFQGYCPGVGTGRAHRRAQLRLNNFDLAPPPPRRVHREIDVKALHTLRRQRSERGHRATDLESEPGRRPALSLIAPS